MLQNAYFLAKIGADAAENERNFAEKLQKFGNYPSSSVVLELQRVFDLDGDGQITREEVALAIERRNGVFPSEILLDNVMAALDADDDGAISRAEFAELRGRARRRVLR